MFTAEEIDNFDIFPKEITFRCLFKSVFYFITTMIFFVVIFSFYTGPDFIHLMTFDSIYYSGNDYLSNRFADRTFMEQNKSKYLVNYSVSISDIFFKQKINYNFPCLIGNGTNGFNINSIYNEIISLVNESQCEIEVEKRDEKLLEFYKRGVKTSNITYQNYNLLKNKNTTSDILVINDFFIDNLKENLSKRLVYNFIETPLLSKYMELKGIYYSEGKNAIVFGGHSEMTENFICIIKGKINIILISGLERKYVYPYSKEYGPSDYSPVYFFIPERFKFPLFNNANRINVQITEGDCLYIPSFYWRSLETKDEDYIFITLKYSSPSRYLNSIFKGIENELI